MPKAKPLPRITTKTIAASSYDCYGIVESVKTGDDGKGPWFQFRGQFEAVLPDGAEFSSGRCHVPGSDQGRIFDLWQRAQAVDPRACIQFALRVEVLPPDACGIQTYRVTELSPAKEHNPMKLLRESIVSAAISSAGSHT